jgi:hypothetical protein
MLLSAAAMNTTLKYTPMVAFGSTDNSFTTTNPKIGAFINGEVTESYTADDTSGMLLNFGVTNTGQTTPTLAPTMQLTTTSLRPASSDGLALGASTRMWSDLFLASGGVINFDNGNATLTHSTGKITSNVDIAVPDEAYGSGWNASTEVPTKNAVYDKLESMQMVYTLASDASTAADTNYIDLSGMVFNYEANSTYTIDFYGAIESAANTTGYAFAFNLSSAVTTVWLQTVHNNNASGGMLGSSSTGDDTNSSVPTSVNGSGTVNPVMGRGLLITTSNTGTAQLRYRSEVSAVTTCKAGTTIVVRKIA